MWKRRSGRRNGKMWHKYGIFAMGSQWSDWTCNLVTVPSRLNPDLSSAPCDMNPICFTEYCTQSRGCKEIKHCSPSQCKNMLMWIRLYMSVTSVHSTCLNTHISGLQARHQAYWSDRSDTHSVSLHASNNKISLTPPPLPLILSPLTYSSHFCHSLIFSFPPPSFWLPTSSPQLPSSVFT